MALGKTLVRAGVITAVVGGAAAVIAGPERLGAVFTQAREKVHSAIDAHVDDPVALRAQIKKLESEYPERIASIRGDLAEVQGQISEMHRELQVAHKVVELTAGDLSELDSLISEARAVQGANPGAVVRVAFSTERVNLDEAYAKRSRIQQTQDLYTQRASDLETDLGYLEAQETQLGDLLVKLEAEHAEFQTKLFQLDAQIDAIARNERLIEMMEDRQVTIDEQSRYQAHSLEQLNTRLSSIREQQRGRIDSITRREQGKDYAEQAEFLLRTEGDGTVSVITPARPKSIDVTAPAAPSAPRTPMATTPDNAG
jgi:predicted RNase H-like nuclease (RuvC/YqgF family)